MEKIKRANLLKSRKLRERKEKHNKNELIILYQRLIEILSAENDEEYKIYLKKLKREMNIQSNPDLRKIVKNPLCSAGACLM